MLVQTLSSRTQMPRGKRNRRPRPSEPRERPETPQTRAKLKPHPLDMILMGQDVSLEYAADEIRAVFMCVCQGLFSARQRAGSIEGIDSIPDELAWAHAQTYIPWANATPREILRTCIDVIVDGYKPPYGRAPIQQALRDYAKRMRERPKMEDAA